MADVSLRPPPMLDISATNLSETFKKWRQQIEIYLLASGATAKDNKIQKAIILHCAGSTVIELEHHFTYADDEDKNSSNVLLTKLSEYCNPRKNVVMESHRFWKLYRSEPFDAYLTQLRNRAESCEYQDPNRMIRDKIVFTAPGKLQEMLLRETKLTLDKAIDLCRIYESSIKQTQKMLTMWNKTKLKPEGKTILKVTNPKNSTTHSVKFVVVSDSLNCLLGLNTVQMMNLIRVNAESFIAKIAANDDLGKLGVVSLHVDPYIRPKVLPSRNIPIALRQTVKAKLDELGHRKVISPVHEPTDWVSQMAIVKKPNGDIRICIDPQPLNTALKREHYKLPVLDDILPDLSHAKIFFKTGCESSILACRA